MSDAVFHGGGRQPALIRKQTRKVQSLGCRVQDLGLRGLGFGVPIQGLGFN